jgi:type I restriction enzyme M protein
MITGALRSQIDKLWTEFWTGGIANPLTVIEQISYLMFARLLDMNETRHERKFARTNPGEPFPGVYFRPDQAYLRWGSLRHEGDAEKMLKLVRDELFPHMRRLSESSETFGHLMAEAQLMIQKPSLLASAVRMIEALPLTEGDTKGDLYEYLLSKLTQAGINGQFRTPRHIIRAMVEIADPQPTERIGDPACGTAGFLVSTMLYLQERYSSPEGIYDEVQDDGTVQKVYTGDLLEPYREHIATDLLHGFDFDSSMLLISSMNLMLHGLDSPGIRYQDTLSNGFPEKYPQYAHNAFDVILANPPFKGSLDHADVHSSLTGQVKTKKTELLFLALILRMLKNPGGRAATIVPDGVLFGSNKAHRGIRQILVDKNQLDAVISLPSGVFKPYAGVSTAILVFTRGGQTTDVFFYDVQADGYSLDDKRDKIDQDDLPGLIERWKDRDPKKDTDRKAKAFFVPAQEIRDQKYDLSINRYKEIEYEEVHYDPPKVILARLRELEDEIRKDLDELEGML